MSYSEKFKELLKETAKGFGIGLVVSAILMAIIESQGEFDIETFIVFTLMLTILIGSILAIGFASRAGENGLVNGAAERVWVGMKSLFFGSISGGSAFFFVFGIIKIMIGVIIMIPVGTFMALSYFFNLIYLGIMSSLEKKNKLEDKADLCEKLDLVTPILAGVVTAVLCIVIVVVIS